MSQHDFDIANQSASSARSDINNALKALASLSSGSTAPSTTYANMLWYDTSNNTLKMRAEADDAWISIGYLNQSTDTFALFDDTKVVNSGGTQTGLLGDQSTSVWEAGTGTTESLVSPAKVKAAIEALAPEASDLEATDMSSVSAGDLVLTTVRGQSGNVTNNTLVAQRSCTLRLKFDVLCETNTEAFVRKNGTTFQTYTVLNDGNNKSLDVSLVAGDILSFRTESGLSGGGDTESSFSDITVCANKRSFVFYPAV